MRPQKSRASSEKDQIYCSFFERTGACMHGEICSRMHIKPQVSNTLLLANFYQNPYYFIGLLPPDTLIIESETIRNNFNEFYIDIFEELRTFGVISELLISGNLCEHLLGNVYVMYENLENAIAAYNNLRGRYYGGRPIDVQFSPVFNFNAAVCRQFRETSCPHKEKCNFIHPIMPSGNVQEMCHLTHSPVNSSLSHQDQQNGRNQNQNQRYRDRDRGYDRDRDRGYDRDRDRDSNYDRHRDRDRDRDYSYNQKNRNYRYNYNDNRDRSPPQHDHYDNQRREYPTPESFQNQDRHDYPQPERFQSDRRRYPSPDQDDYGRRSQNDRNYHRNQNERNYNDRGYNRGNRRDSY